MLTASDIRHLSDKDLAAELAKAKNALYRQSIGLRTGHLKATHTASSIKRLIARLLTIATERRAKGMAVETSTGEAVKKLETAYGLLAVKPTKKKSVAKKAEAAEPTESATGDVKVKKATK